MRFNTKSIIDFYITGKLKPTPPTCFDVMGYSATSFRFWCRQNPPQSTNFSRGEKLKIKNRLIHLGGVPVNAEYDWLNL